MKSLWPIGSSDAMTRGGGRATAAWFPQHKFVMSAYPPLPMSRPRLESGGGRLAAAEDFVVNLDPAAAESRHRNFL